MKVTALSRTGILCAIFLACLAVSPRTGLATDDATVRTDCDGLVADPWTPGDKIGDTAPRRIDTRKALPICQAAVAKFPDSQRLHSKLGKVYDQAQRFGEAAAEYQKAAQAGYAPAQSALGIMYLMGRGVPQDEAQARAWVRMAADQGFAPAQTNLGLMFERGRAAPKDDAQAAEWFRKAADQEFAPAQYHLGRLSAKDRRFREAADEFQKAAEQGYAPAQNALGALILSVKGPGVPEDETQAIGWLRRAADQGFAPAQNILGLIYEQGRIVPRDGAQAAQWFRRAAERGFAQAQYNLGLLYQKGLGVPKDDAQAEAWLRRAKERGYTPRAGAPLIGDEAIPILE